VQCRHRRPVESAGDGVARWGWGGGQMEDVEDWKQPIYGMYAYSYLSGYRHNRSTESQGSGCNTSLESLWHISLGHSVTLNAGQDARGCENVQNVADKGQMLECLKPTHCR